MKKFEIFKTKENNFEGKHQNEGTAVGIHKSST